jgi:hypothetical protein
VQVDGSLSVSGVSGTDGIVFPDGSKQTSAVDGSQVQKRVTASCPDGQAISAIDSSGGVTCHTGLQGAKGDKGDTGATGPQGPAGPPISDCTQVQFPAAYTNLQSGHSLTGTCPSGYYSISMLSSVLNINYSYPQKDSGAITCTSQICQVNQAAVVLRCCK